MTILLIIVVTACICFLTLFVAGARVYVDAQRIAAETEAHIKLASIRQIGHGN